jgi:hypothetical protein
VVSDLHAESFVFRYGRSDFEGRPHRAYAPANHLGDPMTTGSVGDDFSTQVKQLTLEFNELPQAQIEESVTKHAKTYEGARVTTFVPLLVERSAREELRRKTRGRRAAS